MAPLSMPRPRPWNPQEDVDEALAFSDPVTQNRALINDSRNNWTSVPTLPEWNDYRSVLAGRGAQMALPRYDLRSSLPAGYTEEALDQELDSFANTGRVGGQGMQKPALAGLHSASGLKPQERGRIAGNVRASLLPGGRII